MTNYNDDLRAAWEQFCEGLKGQIDLIYRDDTPDTELDRAWGVRYMGRYINKALNDVLEYLDPDFPQLWVMQHPTSKTFGDNPDATYMVARLDGSKTYRITGNRGTVNWVRFVLTPYEELVGGSVLTGANIVTLPGEDMKVEWDGSYTITISPEPHEGNWIKPPEGMSRLMIRQFFGEWDKETPMSAMIERVGAEGEKPAPLTADRMIKALADANNYIAKDADRWYRWTSFYKQNPNSFYKGRPSWAGGTEEAERNVGRWLNIAYFEIEDDEAFVIEFTPPQVFMWLFELNNFWMNSVDYRYHFSSLNSKQAAVDPDGKVRIVIANKDPGIPNWLDPAGHKEGQVMGRWIGPAPDAENVTPTGTVVKLADLASYLPANVRRTTPEQRIEQWRRLKAGVENRFGPGR